MIDEKRRIVLLIFYSYANRVTNFIFVLLIRLFSLQLFVSILALVQHFVAGKNRSHRAGFGVVRVIGGLESFCSAGFRGATDCCSGGIFLLEFPLTIGGRNFLSLAHKLLY